MAKRRTVKNQVKLVAPSVPSIKARTPNQQKYIEAIYNKELIFSVGPAGTGKTWLATSLAAQHFADSKISRIILSRPAVEAGEHLGFLPGELEQKFSPYLAPFIDVLYDRLGNSHVEYLLKKKAIEAIPLAYMRGRTFKDCWVILDEAQNTTPSQMKMFLTRIGENCKVIVNGDITQKDIKSDDGLNDAVRRLANYADAAIIKFDKSDVVRSGLVRKILDVYEDIK